MKSNEFLDLSTMSKQLVNRKKAVDGTNVEWLKIQTICFVKNRPGIMQYKYVCDDESEWSEVDFRRGKANNRTNKSTHVVMAVASRKIKLEKWKDLQSLKQFIPPIYHAFYDGLPTCFAVSTDASNLKNRKMFPICVQYFNIECGVNKKLIVFDEQNDECSVAVGEMLKTGLNKIGLDVKNVSAYSADNASVNYGVRQSVFTELKALNKNIVKANCNAHITHNTLRKVVDLLDCDVETLVTAVYGHFSISANRRVELQEVFYIFGYGISGNN